MSRLSRNARLRIQIGLATLAILVYGCSPTPSDVPREPAEALPTSAQASRQLGPGGFHITDLGSPAGGGSRYIAASGGTCKFEVLINKSIPTADAQFSFAEAALSRQPGADCTTFLRALAKHLGFSGELPNPARIERLPASLAVLGTNQSRSDAGEVAGGFSSTPSGSWTAMKLFLAGGEGEVFLNINAREGLGEFSIKDEDYATIVVTELAKVLLPKAG